MTEFPFKWWPNFFMKPKAAFGQTPQIIKIIKLIQIKIQSYSTFKRGYYL